MSIFNPDQFLTTQHTGQLDTKIIQVPPNEYIAQVNGVAVRAIPEKDGKGPFYVCEIQWEVQDDGVKTLTKRDHPTVRQDFFLDITAEGALDMGPQKNVQLGRVREAVGMNQPDRPFSLIGMNGVMAKIKVGSRPNPKDPESPFAYVTAVTKL